MKNTRYAPLGLALACLLCFASCNEFQGPVDLQVLRETRPLGDAKELAVELKYDVGQLEIVRAPEDLFNLDLQYDRNHFTPRFKFDEGNRSSMRLDLDSREGWGSRGGKENDLTLRVTDKIPVEINLTAGVSESRLELTGIKLRRMHLTGGVGKTEVTFDKPSGEILNSLDIESGVGEVIIHGLGNAQVGQVDLKGGVGNTELDFTGESGTVQTSASIKVGVGAVKLTLPRDADIEVEAQGSFLSNISAPELERDGRNYTHRGGGGSKIRIRVESGVGAVEIELI